MHGWYKDRAGAATDRRACETTVEGQMPWHGIPGSGPLPTHSRPPLTSWTTTRTAASLPPRGQEQESAAPQTTPRRSSSSETSDDEEEDVDRRREHQLALTCSKIASAPASLRLPAMTTRAERRLRHRRNYV